MDASLLGDGPLPYSAAHLPGIGGALKECAEDFVVEEIPAYEPAGEGDHAFLWIEKRNLTTQQAVRRIAEVTGADERDIGVAGLKDRFALCRQYVSIPAKFADRVAGVEDESMRVLHVRRHRNKLRTGHLKGNRFSVLVRGVCTEALARADAIQRHVAQHGFPNYFGEQRFGSAFQTAQTGIALLKGDTGAKDLPPGSRRFSLRFAISAVQSLLFNAALRARMNDGLTQTVLLGDVMQVTATGGLFVVHDVEREQGRCDRRETAITGPMFGPKMKQPEEEVATRERDILDRYGLGADAFLKYRRLSSGTRRPYLAWPEALSIELHENGMQFCFALRPGTYATVLLREFMQV